MSHQHVLQSDTSINFDELIESLDQYTDRIPLDVLADLLARLDVSVEELKQHLGFSEAHYKRNLVHETSACQVLLLCWLNGQRSQIHDHVGSSCGVKVLRGTSIETTFARAANGMIYAIGSEELPEGSVCASEDDDIHQISNLQADDACQVTLHIYSPPLQNMNVYNLCESKAKVVSDPMAELLYSDDCD